MSHLKTQKSRSLVSPLMVIVISFTLATLSSCGKSNDVKASRQPKNKLDSNANVKNTTTATKQTTKTFAAVWICASCGHQNTKPGDSCTGCGLSKQDIRDNVTKRKQKRTGNLNKSNPHVKEGQGENPDFQENETKEICPVCLEDDVLTERQTCECEQCKKLICFKCYKKMQRIEMDFCPMCRYVPGPQPKLQSQLERKHRKRSNTV